MIDIRGHFPTTRLRRNRSSDWTRRLVAENRLSVDDLIWPIFLREDDDPEAEIVSMPGQRRLTLAEAVERVGRAAELGVPAVALFPKVPERLKTPGCEEAINP